MNSIDKKLDDLMKTIDSDKTSGAVSGRAENVPSTSIWNDPEKLATVKAPPSRAALVIPANQNREEENNNRCIIEKTLLVWLP